MQTTFIPNQKVSSKNKKGIAHLIPKGSFIVVTPAAGKKSKPKKS